MKNTFLILGLMALMATEAKADTPTPIVMGENDTPSYQNCYGATGCTREKAPTGLYVYYTINSNTMTFYGPKTGSAHTVAIDALPENITHMNFEGKVNIYQNSGFKTGNNLTSVDFTGVDTINSWAFSGSGLTGHLDLRGVRSISQYAFSGSTGITSVDLTGINTIDGWTFYGATNLESVDLTGVRKIHQAAFQSTALTSLVLPDTVFNTDGNLNIYYNGCTSNCFGLHSGALNGTQITTMYYPEGKTPPTDKFSNTTFISYTKDAESGVYTVGDKMYATAIDLTSPTPIECTTGLRDCQIRALTYQGDKCTTQTECSNLIDMVSDSNYDCNSITTCSAFAKDAANNINLASLYGAPAGGNGGTGGTGSSTGSGKRIYTVEEARQAVEAAGTDTVNFRIRYK